MDAVDLFAGPGGWDVAARGLGIDVTGIEWDSHAVATRMCAGLDTIDMDVRDVDPLIFADDDGLIASPPCPTFSVAGSGEGRRNLDRVLHAVESIARHGGAVSTEAITAMTAGLDERTALILYPFMWALAIRPRWIAFEQVPPVLPVWQVIAKHLRDIGYHADARLLNSEEYGVPQTRRRAILMASLDHLPQPIATHRVFSNNVPQDKGDPRLLPWVSMAEALGWGPDPDDVIARASAIEYCASDTAVDLTRPLRRPATAVVVATRKVIVHPGGNRSSSNNATKSRNDGLRLPPDECGVLQSFPADYPWCGAAKSQYLQIGNAIPPLMAKAILAACI